MPQKRALAKGDPCAHRPIAISTAPRIGYPTGTRSTDAAYNSSGQSARSPLATVLWCGIAFLAIMFVGTMLLIVLSSPVEGGIGSVSRNQFFQP